MIKRLLAFLIAITMLLNVVACGKEQASSDTASTDSQPVDIISSDESSSEESSSASGGVVTQENFGGDVGAVKGNGEVSSQEESRVDEVFEDNSNNDDLYGYDWAWHDGVHFKPEKWDGPNGYVIVIPDGNDSAKSAATRLQSYFLAKTSVNLSIVTDNKAAVENEILVGKTNRSESSKTLKENELKVSVKGKKLVFDGGHDFTVETAVKYFCRVYYEKGKANTLSETVDFTTKSPLAGYSYVWGDEFIDNDVDFTKWCLNAKMGGTNIAPISPEKDVINVVDGKLRLSAIKYSNPNNPAVKYKLPHSVSTETHMNFVYGYAEIKAKLPYFTGAWPSFWTQSTDKVSSKYGVYRNKNYFVEVDVFEVFGSKDTAVSNIHKWYSNGGGHTQWNKKKTTWKGNSATINSEYHTYGWEWTPTEMTMYVDGSKIMTYDITTSYDSNADMSGFHDPEFVMFNNHLFVEDSSFKTNLITGNEKMLPAVYDIEYFRLYQKNDGKSKIYFDRTLSVPSGR